MIEAVLFDFGGTLDSDGGHWLDRTWALYERRGLSFPRDAIQRAFYVADAAVVQREAVRHRTLRGLIGEHFDHQLRELGGARAADHAWLAGEFAAEMATTMARNAPLLARLARRRPLGVLSNFYGNLEEICEEAGIADHFTVILDSEREGLSKPDPAYFRLALERLGTPAARVAMVGDNVSRDIEPAAALGMTTYWLAGPDRTALPQPSAAHHRAATLPEVVAHLEAGA